MPRPVSPRRSVALFMLSVRLIDVISPNLGLVRVSLCNLCYLYSLVKMDSGVLFYLVWFCVFLQCFDTVGWVI